MYTPYCEKNAPPSTSVPKNWCTLLDPYYTGVHPIAKSAPPITSVKAYSKKVYIVAPYYKICIP